MAHFDAALEDQGRLGSGAGVVGGDDADVPVVGDLDVATELDVADVGVGRVAADDVVGAVAGVPGRR